MHYVIDDFVWIAIGLVVVAFLFMLGAACIFLDEGIRRLIRSFRKPASLTIQGAVGKSGEMLQGIKSQIINPDRSAGPTFWHTLRSKVRDAKSGTFHFHIGHRKPANAKS